MTTDALAGILGSLRRELSRTPSLVVTVYGDAVVPRGGSLWLGTLLDFFRTLGIGDGAVRTAMSRLAADGWLERRRVGRNSFYRLAPRGRATFAAATEHIYRPRPPPWDGRLLLLLPEPGALGPDAATALAAGGFGSPGPGLFAAVAGTPVPPEAGDVLRMEAPVDDATAARLAARAWPLGWAADAYRRFADTFRPLHDALAAGATPSDIEAFTARILLIHAYRRVVLRDPILPSALLPAGWPGRDAQALCAALYLALLPASEAWLDRHGRSEGGPLPPPGPELRRRLMLHDPLNSDAD